MPVYSYECQECGNTFDNVLPISQYNDPQTCPECGAHPAKKLVVPTNFILKGDGWAGKNHTIARQMEKKNQRLRVKGEERKREAPGLTLAPNVDGQRVDSWSDAAKLAKDKGKDTTGYVSRAQKEK